VVEDPGGEGLAWEAGAPSPGGVRVLLPRLRAAFSPYLTHAIRRFGDWVLDLSPPEAVPTTTLDLVPGALFPGDIAQATAPGRPPHQRATSKNGS
jgi:hypothetical protein